MQAAQGQYRHQGRFILRNSLFFYSALSVLSSGSPSVCRTERQRSLALTPTHCVRCCPFFLRIALRLFGKCNSSGGKPQRLHSNRLPPACCPFCQADRHRLSGQNGNGLKSCGSHMGLSAICSANRDKSPSEASRSTESALSQRACELRNVPKRRKSTHRKYGGTA